MAPSLVFLGDGGRSHSYPCEISGGWAIPPSLCWERVEAECLLERLVINDTSSSFRMDEWRAVAKASAVPSCEVEVCFTPAIVKLVEAWPPHLLPTEKEMRMPLPPPLFVEGGPFLGGEECDNCHSILLAKGRRRRVGHGMCRSCLEKWRSDSLLPLPKGY